MSDSFRNALIQSDALLSRYQPLDHLMVVNDFNTGIHGWQTLFPDYDGWNDYPERYPPVEPLSQILENSRQNQSLRVDRRIPVGRRGVPMLTSMTSWDIGTQGTLNGTYALKIPTLARRGDKGLAVKRLTQPFGGLLRIETYFTYKADPVDFRLGELDIRSFFLAMDVMDAHDHIPSGTNPVRWWPGVRYYNAHDGKLVQQWQAMLKGSEGVMDGPWDDLPDGQQSLGFNRSPSKYQWHYLRLTIDLDQHEYVDFNCYGKEFAVKGLNHTMTPPLTGFRASTDKCSALAAIIFGVEADQDKRCALMLDSLVISISNTRS